MQPRITVLVPTFNRADFLAECLESLLNQSLPPSQIIVVDDGSEDHTRSVIEPYANKVEYYATDQLGKPGAINFGLLKVSGDYLWIFDDDDVALPDALLRFVKPLEENQDYDFSFSTYFYTTSRSDNRRIGEVVGEQHIPDLVRRGPLIPLLEWNYLGGAALFARTSIYDRVGSFDTRLKRSQDYEMAVRIVRKFTGIQVDGGPTFHYRQHDNLRGCKIERFQSHEKIKYWLKYDQIIFRTIYEELPLAEYLPPGGSLKEKRRQALLQRIAIMRSKLLFAEAAKDLQLLSQISDHLPFSPEEKTLVVQILKPPFYKLESKIDKHLFFQEMEKLSTSCETIKMLKTEIISILDKAELKARLPSH